MLFIYGIYDSKIDDGFGLQIQIWEPSMCSWYLKLWGWMRFLKEWLIGRIRGSRTELWVYLCLEARDMKRSQPRRLRSGWVKSVSKRRKSQTMPHAAIRSIEMRTKSILLYLAMRGLVVRARIYHCMEVFCSKEVQKDGVVAGGGRIQSKYLMTSEWTIGEGRNMSDLEWLNCLSCCLRRWISYTLSLLILWDLLIIKLGHSGLEPFVTRNLVKRVFLWLIRPSELNLIRALRENIKYVPAILIDFFH